MQIKVSIIVPIYNVQEYLVRCLDSLCAQTLEDIEIICIDDCSSDNSLEIANNYAQKDSRIIVLSSEKNCGVSTARNKGLAIAKGEFLAFVDPDDYIDLNFLEVLYNTAIKENMDIVKANYCKITEYSEEIRTPINEFAIKNNNRFYFLSEWTSALYKHTIVKENSILFNKNLDILEDLLFVFSCMLASDKVLFLLDSVCYYHIKRPNCLDSRIISHKKVISKCKAILLCQELNNNSNLYNENRHAYFGVHISNAQQHLTALPLRIEEEKSLELIAKTFLDLFNNSKNKEELLKKYYCKELVPALEKDDVPTLVKILGKFKPKVPEYMQYTKIEEVNKLLANPYSYVHIFENRNTFLTDVVHFINNNFDSSKHIFITPLTCSFALPAEANVYFIKIEELAALNLSHNHIKQVIWHNLYPVEYVHYLYKHKDVLAKSFWVIWGTDLTYAPRSRMQDFVRGNFKGYATGMVKILEEKYTIKHKNFFKASYLHYGTKEDFAKLRRKKGDVVRIQINISADITTIEALHSLAKFKDMNIEINTILSYGSTGLNEEIIKLGKEIFKDKFIPMLNFMPKKEYFQHLANNDILILAHNEERGSGNAIASLYQGKKLFIKKDLATYQKIEKLKLPISDTHSIAKYNFQEFIDNSKTDLPTTQKILDEEYYDISAKARKWQFLFEQV